MCETIRLKNKDIQTVKQFEEHFNITLEGDIDKDCCLCQINLKEFFKDKPNFEYDCGDWWEI